MAQVGKDKELTGLVSWKEETSSGGGNSAAEAGATTSVRAKPAPKRQPIAFFGSAVLVFEQRYLWKSESHPKRGAGLLDPAWPLFLGRVIHRVARVCLAASVVDSFHGNEEEDKGCDLVFVALARHQAKRGTRDDAPSSSLAPLVHLLINCAARPPYPREEIIEELA
ncbi:hypothetical protein QYF36_010471 [Acer negundo]|nr:hypothetical protein QYF36_010471 [Acer negundo]